MRPPVLAILLLSWTVAGCLEPGPIRDQPGWPPLGWTHVPAATEIVVEIEDLAGDDWMLLELVAENESTIRIKSDGAWDFANPALNPDPGLCLVFSGGQPNEGATTAGGPFVVPERLAPGPVEIPPQPEASIQAVGVSESVSLRTTGFGYELGDSLVMAASPSQPSYLAFGMAQWEDWHEAGSRWSLTLESSSAFAYRVVWRGVLDCRLTFAEHDSGTYARTSVVAVATDVQSTFEATNGLVAFLEYSGNIYQSATVTDSQGQGIYSNQTGSGTNIMVGSRQDSVILCSPSTGPWTVEFPRIEGTDHRWTWANTMVLDVPATYQAAFNCLDA